MNEFELTDWKQAFRILKRRLPTESYERMKDEVIRDVPELYGELP